MSLERKKINGIHYKNSKQMVTDQIQTYNKDNHIINIQTYYKDNYIINNLK